MKGKVFIVGTGPGAIAYMSGQAVAALQASDSIVGYKTYIDQIRTLIEGKTIVSSGMRQEVERCRKAIELACEGQTVSVISSGDSGIYGMAGIVLEIIAQENLPIEAEVVPGITSAISSASLLGAPLMNDFAVISLSDLMTPWEVILKRVEAAAMGDFAMAIYNPKSMKRVKQIEIVRDLLLKYQKPETPVGIVKNAMRDDQQVIVSDLAHMLDHDIDMTTTLIIGNSQTAVMQDKMITARGYRL